MWTGSVYDIVMKLYNYVIHIHKGSCMCSEYEAGGFSIFKFRSLLALQEGYVYSQSM